MSTRIREPLRLRAAVTAAGLAAVAGIAAAFLAPEVGPPVAAGGVAVLAGLVSGLAVWAGLAQVSRVVQAAGQVTTGTLDAAEFPAAQGEMATVVAAIEFIESRRSELADSYRSDLDGLAATLATLVSPKATPITPTLVAPFTDSANRVRTTFDDVSKELLATRQRLASLLRILNGLPDAVIVTDGSGLVRFVNPVAEQLLGAASTASQRVHLADMLADPSHLDTTAPDPDRPVFGGAEATTWLQEGATESIVVRTREHKLVEISGLVSRRGARDALVCLVGRNLDPARRRDTDDRAIIRANATRQVLDRYLADTTEGLGQIAAQLRLLTGDAKQSGQRDAMLTKLTAAGRGLNRLETFHVLAQWYRSAVWGEMPAPTPSEFQAVEVVNLVESRLADRFKARGNSLKVSDHGGWLFADADRLEAALTGLLVHACDATANNPIELRVRRVPAGPDRAIPVTEFHLPDAGPALTPEMLGMIDRPFGGLSPAAFARFDALGGCPLGLVLAARIAADLEGELRIEPDAGGQLELRLTVPTRLTAAEPPVTVSAAAPGALDVAPLEEMVIGWRLGSPGA